RYILSSYLLTSRHSRFLLLFSFHSPPPTHLYTLSLHDALPIYLPKAGPGALRFSGPMCGITDPTAQWEILLHATSPRLDGVPREDRKSTRLNSSHQIISYAVFCLKKKIKEKDLNDNMTRITTKA